MKTFSNAEVSPELESSVRRIMDTFILKSTEATGWCDLESCYGVICITNDKTIFFQLPVADMFLKKNTEISQSFEEMVCTVGGKAIHKYIERDQHIDSFSDGCHQVVSDVAIFIEIDGGLPSLSKNTILSALIAAFMTEYKEALILDHDRRVVFLAANLSKWLE